MRNMRRRGRRGVTLLELLAVVIIVGVLASIGIPQYLRVVERGRMTEAFQALAAVRTSQARFFAEHSAYAATYPELDFNPTNATDLQGRRFFTFTLARPDTTTFTATATRDSTVDFTTLSGCQTNYLITVNQAGVVTGGNCQTAAAPAVATKAPAPVGP